MFIIPQLNNDNSLQGLMKGLGLHTFKRLFSQMYPKTYVKVGRNKRQQNCLRWMPSHIHHKQFWVTCALLKLLKQQRGWIRLTSSISAEWQTVQSGQGLADRKWVKACHTWQLCSCHFHFYRCCINPVSTQIKLVIGYKHINMISIHFVLYISSLLHFHHLF